ncbi:hypothetical protein FB460_0175 [Propioniferax innocua]|uniref:Uncharacterized protein n=2 Tax=Propioniferax innocua TaxID=1753 RepID=A0A542ZQA5_9ACTN|nr:hypothetical protein FB460_0175 [Propioniferax innocua]
MATWLTISPFGEGVSPFEPGAVDSLVYTGQNELMSDTTTIRVSRQTHGRITRLAQQRHETIDQTVDRALRALRQLSMGRELNDELTDEEKTWLDAELG